MKRCPECLFIYPETDTRCDFDNTALVVVDDAEIDAATQGAAPAATATAKKSKRTSKKREPKSATKSTGTPATRRRKTKVVVTAVGLLLGVLGVFGYYSRSSSTPNTIEPIPVASALARVDITVSQPVAVSPAPLETASPSPSPSATQKQTRENVATSHSRTTAAPVSTNGPGIGKKLGAKPVILLASGGKIDADEVWRTRDGVWYRRNGIVTLLKHNRVKAIANQ